MPFPIAANGPLSEQKQKILDALTAVTIPKKRASKNAVEDAMDSDTYEDALEADKPPPAKKPTIQKIEWKHDGLIPRLAVNAPPKDNIALCATGADAADLQRAAVSAATDKADQLKKLTQRVPLQHLLFVNFAMQTKESNTILKVHLENSKEALETLIADPTDEPALGAILGLVAALAQSLVEAEKKMGDPLKMIEISWKSDNPILQGKSPEERMKFALATIAHAQKLEAGGETTLSPDDEKYLASFVAKKMKAPPKTKAPAPKGGAKDTPAGGRAQPPGAGRGGRGGPQGGRAPAACYSCGIPGHRAVDCRNPQRAIAPQYQNNNGQTVWPQVNRGFHGHTGVGPMPGGAPPQPPR